jgi:hypothetical protein
MLKPRMILIILAALLFFSSAALAVGPDATMALDRWVMGGGEAPRASSPLAMQATIGQPVAGHTTASTLEMYWGYWGPQPYAVYLPLVLK